MKFISELGAVHSACYTPGMDNAVVTKYIRDRLPKVEAIYLFGSQASGEQNAGSDVDLAVLVWEKPTGDTFFALKAELSQELKKDIDLVDLARADTVTAAQVVSTGRLLYASDPVRVAHYETYTYAQYAHLNEERREILESIQESGKIYE